MDIHRHNIDKQRKKQCSCTHFTLHQIHDSWINIANSIIWICSKARVHQKSFSRDTTPFPIRDILQVPQEIYFIGKVSTTSTELGLPYQEVFARMKRVGMIENHILPNYNILHTESREHVIDNIDVTYFRLFNIPDSLSELYNLRSTDLYLRPKSKW